MTHDEKTIAVRNIVHEAMCEAETSQMQRKYTKADWLACLESAVKRIMSLELGAQSVPHHKRNVVEW